MFGNNYGTGGGGNDSAGSYGNTYAGQSSRRDNFNVRDCMYWPASLNMTDIQRGRGNGGGVSVAPPNPTLGLAEQFYPQAMPAQHFGSDPYTFHTGVTGDYGTGEPVQVQASQGPVKAYMSTPGEGGAAGQPIPIPCHMGAGPGQVPAIPNMQALGYKVTVPQIPPTPPVDFDVRQ